jgi:hypothetical protein
MESYRNLEVLEAYQPARRELERVIGELAELERTFGEHAAAALGKISPGLLGKLRPGGSRDCARNLVRVASAGTEAESRLR